MEQLDFPVTFYHRAFGYFHRVECRWLSWEFVAGKFYLGSFRQNLSLEYSLRKDIQKFGDRFNGNNHFVLLEGWGHPNHGDKMWLVDQTSHHKMYPVFDEQWTKDFDKFLDSYLKSTPQTELLLDARQRDFSLGISFMPQDTLTEGTPRAVVLNIYERNPKARRQCIEHYGFACAVCNFDFARMYGAVGDGYIHVHHLIPLSEVAEEHEVNPITDLRPVCANCHAIIHRRTPPHTIEEVRNFLAESRKQY